MTGKTDKVDLIEMEHFCLRPYRKAEKTSYRHGENLWKPHSQPTAYVRILNARQNKPVRNCAEDMKSDISNEGAQTANERVRRCRTPPPLRETRLGPQAAPAHTPESGDEGKPRPPRTRARMRGRGPHSAGGNLAGAGTPENSLAVS